MKTLLLLFPREWRDRYGQEFIALLEAQPRIGLGALLDVVRSALAAHADAGSQPDRSLAHQGGPVMTARYLLAAAGLIALIGASSAAVFLAPPSQSALRRIEDLAPWTLAILPIALLVAVGWAVWRHGDSTLRQAAREVGPGVLLVFAVGVTLLGTLSPSLGIGEGAAQIELIPFRELASADDPSARGAAIAIVGANVAMFALVGFALAMRWRQLSVVQVLVLIVAAAVLIEIAQAAMSAGRIVDTTAVLCRVIGGTLGFLAWSVPVGFGTRHREGGGEVGPAA